MKQILFITLSVFTLISFGQQTYKINEGKLEFICHGKGIIIKKENQFYELKINPTFNKQKQEIKTQLVPITEKNVKSYKEKNKIITYDEINENYDFEKLKKLSFNYIEKFRSEDKDYDEYKLCQINNNFFAIFIEKHENKNSYKSFEDYMPYIFIEFNNKKIIYTYDNEELFIIPTKKNVQILSLYDNYIVNYKTQKLKLTNSEIYQFTQHSFPNLDDDFFIIDTLPNKKVQLKNIYNETIINQSYDSIILSPIIKCYNNRKIDLYNLTYKKLNKTPLKAIKGNLGSIQILEKNKVNWIDWTGKKIKKSIFYPYIMLPEAIQKKYYYEVEITKVKNKFTLKTRDFTSFATEYEGTSSDSVSLINTGKIIKFYFKSNISKDTISNYYEFYQFNGFGAKITEVIDFGYEIIYFLKEDGTYGIKYLGNFLNNLNFNIENTEYKEFEEYQNLQFIEYKNNFYKMKKDNLYKLFPLQKEFRYKKLYDFKGNFAKFELPNGQKGWLTLDGIEYSDD